jgi:hypothetical protein
MERKTNMTSRAVTRVFALVALTFATFISCGSDEDDYDDGAGVCRIGDPVLGRDCACNSNDCICPSSGDCALHCISFCSLQCAGSGNCEFDCGASCDTSCTGSGNCLIEVGPDSDVACTGSGNCDITCIGDCSVRCPGQGTCVVRCGPDATCAIEQCSGDVETCSDGVQVCQGNCPG